MLEIATMKRSFWFARRSSFGIGGVGQVKTPQAELMGTPQFDSGRWKLRLERVPTSTDQRFFGPVISSIAVGITILSPVICLIAAYLWAVIAT
jgi:hypothetical protein